MKLNEINEDVGKNDYHTESFYAPIVAKFINDEGVAFWDDIYSYVEQKVDFTAADTTNVPSRKIPRWKIVVANLQQHRTLEGGKFGDIVRIKGGFATAVAAKELDIEILPANSYSPRNHGNRQPVNIERKTGEIVGKAYAELGHPALRNSSVTRKAIESMVKSDPWLPDEELISLAQDIIAANVK